MNSCVVTKAHSPPLTRGGAGCCWLSTSSTRLCSSSWCHPRCRTESRQQHQSDTSPLWPEDVKPAEIPDTSHRAKISAKNKLSKRPALADCLHYRCLPLCLHYSFPPLPLPMLCLAGPPGFSTTAGQTHTAFANKCSSVLVKLMLDFKRRRILNH